MSKTLIDDGYNAHWVQNALFDGIMEIPHINKPDKIIIPQRLVPFTCRSKTTGQNETLCFYVHDEKFEDVTLHPDKYLGELHKFESVVTPDDSLYIDMPLCLQITNVYFSRAVGHYLQSLGMYVIPNVRWGDERTYTTCVLPEKIAFLGIEKHSIVAIGTYGCIKSKEAQLRFRAGLIAMLDELEPEAVLVYGAMPKPVFDGLYHRTKFLQYKDWISSKKGGPNGNR